MTIWPTVYKATLSKFKDINSNFVSMSDFFTNFNGKETGARYFFL